MRTSGSRMRRIGRFRSEASPSKVAVTGCEPTTPHHQPRAGPGIAEIEGRRGLGQSADAGPGDAPAALAEAMGAAAERPHGRGGADHVLAFQQVLDLRLAQRQAADDQRPVRDRLVARHRDAARQARSGP